MKRLNSLLIGFSLMAIAGCSYWRSAHSSQPVSASQFPKEVPNSQLMQVVKVSDGDTLTVMADGRELKIRLCGINAPEQAQPLGAESKAHLQKLIAEAAGQVAVTAVETDRYGRTVAEVNVLGEIEKSMQEEQLRSGMAYVYPQYIDGCPNATAFQNAEEIGQQAKVGVWSGNYQRPWEYRREQRQREGS